MSSLKTPFVAAIIGLLACLSDIARATVYDLELVYLAVGSPQGASAAGPLDTTGTWIYDDTTGFVILSGTLLADFHISAAAKLFSHTMANVEFDTGGVAINGSAYECIEGTFGLAVASNLCANARYGANGINETTWDYSTVPGTRTVGGDDIPLGPQQQLTDYASALIYFDGIVLGLESPAWTNDPEAAGLQLWFTVSDAPPPRDIPNVVGLEQVLAEIQLTDHGLTVGTVSMTNDPGVPAGHVISQNSLACTECARLNDPVDLVVSIGPFTVLTIPERIDDLADDVQALSLSHSLNRFLINTLQGASAPLEYCNGDQSKGGNRRRNRRAGNCRDGGEQKAIQRLELFSRIVGLRSGSRIPVKDAQALIAKALEIIDDILQKPPSTGLHKFMSGGVERSYYLRVPENYSEYGDPLPVIFGFHGATGTYLDWFEGGFHGDGLQKVVGDQAIMVFPQALESSGGITLWNGEVDLDFFVDLLSRLQGQLLIDPNRIFATGHSAGGGFSHQLGCHFGDIIRAVAPSSGFLLARECIGSVAMLQMQSTEDMVAAIGLVELTRDVWAAYNGYELDIFSDGIVEPCIDYSLGRSLYPVQWCAHSSTGADGHQWWDGADEAIWKFFSGLPTAVPTTDPPPGGGNDRILEELPASLSFTVRYPANMNDITLLTAVLYPAGTQQPIFNAPLWFLNGDIPFAPGTPGTEQTYENVPISLFASSPDTPLPGTYTLSIGVFVEGGSFPIPASGIDHIALIEVEIEDQFSPIIVEEILDLVPVQGF